MTDAATAVVSPAPAVTPDPGAAAAPAVTPAVSPSPDPAATPDPLAGLKPSDNLLGNAPEKPAAETPEQKAARLAAETPEQKTAREAAEKAEALKNETPEQKAEREKAEKAAAEKDAPKPLTAETIKLPEGVDPKSPLVEKFVGFANEHKLTGAQAEAAAAFWQAQMGEIAAEPYKLWAKTQEDWIGQVKADPEIGQGNFDTMRANFANALEVVSRGDKAFQADVRNALISTGAGNNPAIVRFVNRMAQAVTEGGHVGGAPASSPKSAGQILYG